MIQASRSTLGRGGGTAVLDGREGTLPVAPPLDPLHDALGRVIGDLRVSVTDRCNFRCTYCMPAEGMRWLDRAALLTFEEIERLVGLFARMGVDEVRLTGGEPLARRGITDLVSRIAGVPGVRDLSLTTNGYLLAPLADDLIAAGLTRINVSLDTLSHERFEQIARRDALDRVLAGLAALERHPRFGPVKVNVVAMRGFTEREVLDFARFARARRFVVRFIEFMPLDAGETWRADMVLTGEEIRGLIDARFPLAPLGREPGGTATRYRFADGRGEIGFISPVSQPFCGDCNRIRITADGKLRTCLFSLRETDLRAPLREGASDADLEQLIRDAVWRKEQKHHVGEPGFVPPPRKMSQIGG